MTRLVEPQPGSMPSAPGVEEQGANNAVLRFYLAKPALAFAGTVAVLLLTQWFLLPFAESLARQPGEMYTYAAHLIKTSFGVAAIAVAALPFQLLLPSVRRRPKVSTYEYWLDVLYWHQGLMFQILSVGAAVLAFNQWLWAWAPRPWLPSLASLPGWVQVLVALWLYDLIVYWRHRSEHGIRALWSFHAIHHSTEQVDVLTTLRVHPLEIVYATLTNTAVLMSGIEPEAAAEAYALFTYWNYAIHMNVKFRFSGFMKYILVTPFMHQWHHAPDREANGKNVGVVFAWNDWLFGSAYHPEHWPSRFGLDAPDGHRLPQSYWRQLAYPLEFVWAALRKH